MKHKQLAALLFITLTITLLLAQSTRRTSAVTPSNKETPLNPSGLVYEIFRDSNGELWISDYNAGEIWHVNPTTDAFTVYKGLYGASDGRLDSNGHLWWSSPDDGTFGRLVPGAAQATIWTLPANSSPLGTAFDNNGHVWLSDQYEPNVYQFAPDSEQLCTYTFPDSDPENNGAADYILFHNNHFWLSDWILGRILRLDPTTGAFTSWQLAANAYPLGLAVDANGNLWWADYTLGDLGRLNPQTNNITSFVIPGTSPLPVQVAIEDGKVRYSDESGTLGELDPAVAAGSSATVPPATTQVTAVCQMLAAGSSVGITTQSGSVVWSDASYSVAQNSSGWLIYRLPTGAVPYGLATSASTVWFADQGDEAGVRAQFLGWLELDPDQHIQLNSGWNLISSYIEPAEPALEILLADIVDDIVLMKNNHGQIFWPQFGINQIGSWNALEGYQIYLTNARTLNIAGMQILPETTPISLPATWNLISYLRARPLPINQALASIDGQLLLAKNNSGQVFWPEFGINQIGDMQPGQGYQLYMSVSGTLTYPAN